MVGSFEQAENFLLNYDTYPLAKACLDPPGRMTAATTLDLFDRLNAVWETIRLDSPGLPPMNLVMRDLLPNLSRNRKELLEEFERRLDDIEEAVSFEMFLIEKIQEDPRYR